MSKQEVPPVPFSLPPVTGREELYIQDVLVSRRMCGDGPYTQRCQNWLKDATGSPKVLLTHSCTAALEMAALLSEVGPGDEVIMPSFTFSSTANAFVLRGAVPVFVDIRPDTLNIDETLIEAAVTARTRVIVPMHYAGVGCAMEPIMDLAERRRLLVIEDAAQAVMARQGGRSLGSIGHLGAFSFHETKNVVSGEGGALLINDERFTERADVLWEKGTDRRKFFEGKTDRYTWIDVGSSFPPSEFDAAVLMAQLEAAETITEARRDLWRTYHRAFAGLEAANLLRRPLVPTGCEPNGHIYYILLPTPTRRNAVLKHLRARGVLATFHYVPLHSSPAGRRFGRTAGELHHTDDLSARLIRLPMAPDLAGHADRVIQEVEAAVRECE